MKNKMVLSFVLISFIVLKCVSISHLYKGPIGFRIIMIANSIRLESFEKNIACYYYNYREFRFNEVPLDTIDKELIFTTLQKQYSSDQMVKYNFEMKPYIFTSTSDSSESEVDSINILKFIGSVTFSDSLISQNIDSLIVLMELLEVEATIYEKNDSIYYT